MSNPTPSLWADLGTERRHPASADLDAMAAEEIVQLMIEEERRGLEAALGQAAEVARASAWIAAALEAGGNLHFVGAGTSGRLGVLEAAECPPTFGSDPERIQAHMAGGAEAVFAAREGAEDRFDEGEALAAGMSARDVVVGISASSVTAYVRGALEAASRLGARTVLLTCARPAADLDQTADLVIALGTGPEVLTGSTRLKAGSATKAVLNALTTTAMVALGKVYQNLMVDLRPGSAKLVDRSRRIVAMATGRAPAEAEVALEQAGGEVKTAIVMLALGIDAPAARGRLAEHRGHVRAALVP